MGDVGSRNRPAAARKHRVEPRRTSAPSDSEPASTTRDLARQGRSVRIGALDPDLLAALEDQRRFLRSSLDDLEREHDAGDIDTDDFRSLRDDYEARLAKVDAAIDEGRTQMAAARPPRSFWRTAAVVAGVALFAVGAGVFVAAAAGRRDPGETITGNDPRTAAGTQLLECLDLDRQAQTGEATVSDAFGCYDTLFRENREDPVVLANFGWFLYRAGSSSGQPELIEAGPAFIDQAIERNADYPDAHAYRLIILTQQGRTDEARAELATLDALNPPPEIRELLEPIREQLAEASP